MAAGSHRGCSRVYLPDLISRQKELAVRQQLKTDPNQGAFLLTSEQSRVGTSMQKIARESALTMHSPQQTHPGGAWLRDCHIFKDKELAKLIEDRIPELCITHLYFDHTRITENTEVWKFYGKFPYWRAQGILRGFLSFESSTPLKTIPEIFIALSLFWWEGHVWGRNCFETLRFCDSVFFDFVLKIHLYWNFFLELLFQAEHTLAHWSLFINSCQLRFVAWKQIKYNWKEIAGLFFICASITI